MSDGGFVGDLVDSAVDFGADLFDTGLDFVDSFTDSFGAEFLTGDTFGSLADSFTTSIGDVAGTLYEQVGSFAGNATWFDSFNVGSIVNSAVTTVSDFAGNFTSGLSLPSVSSITNSAIGSLTGYGSSLIPGFAGGGFSIPGLVNSTVANLAGPFAQPVSSVLSGSGFGINTGYGSVATPGFAGALTTGPGLVNSTISNLVGLPGQAVGGVINTGARLVNATLSGLVGTAQAQTLPRPVNTTLTFPDSAYSTTVPVDIDVAGVGINIGSTIAQDPNRASSTGGNFTEFYNSETGLYDIFNNDTGETVQTGLDQQAAILAAQDLSIGNDGQMLDASPNAVDPNNFPAYDEDGNLLPGYELDGDENPVFVGFGRPTTNAADVDLANFPGYDEDGNLLPGYTLDENNNPVFVGGGFVEPATRAQADADRTAALRDQARQQQSIRSQRQNQAQSGDWRVRLRLAPRSTYLYNAADCGPVLWPLRNTDGVIFPYTPNIDLAYKANYEAYDLTHSNYRGYFYKSSNVDNVNLRATFTAQDTAEANYLLAVIHFFRSATKMFYGQDAERGAPPPLVYLSGLGDFQFNEHPCVINQFNYVLPSDVDYIRAQSTVSNGTNLLKSRDRQTIAGNPLSYAINRLASVGLSKGALDNRFASPTLGVNNPTYVPTKMEIQLTLLPIQSRQQVSKEFSLKNFANGNLLKGGFW